MEPLITAISIILLLGLITVPILLFVGIRKLIRPKVGFLTYLLFGVLITAAIAWTLAWWMDYSNQLLMSHYGYDFKAMNETDRSEKVEAENLEKVKRLEIGFFGIGWPLRAFFIYIFYSPYLLIVYMVGQLITRTKRKNKEHAPNST